MDGDTKDVEFTKDKTNQHQARVDNAPNFLELPELPDRPMRRIDVMLNGGTGNEDAPDKT